MVYCNPAPMPDVPEKFDTVFVGTIEKAGMGGQGGFHRRWYVAIRVDEQLRGPPLQHKGVILYLHSPVQEFPDVIGAEPPGSPDYTKPLVGTKCTWALRHEGAGIVEWKRLPANG